MFIFVKEGIRKLSDLNTVIGNNTIYFNRFRLFARTSLVKQELEPQKIEKRRVRPCPKRQVTVSEQILSLANPVHSGCSTQRTRGTNWQYQAHTSKSTVPRDVLQWRYTQRTRGINWQYQAHTSKSTAPRKEMCHSGKPVLNGRKLAMGWLLR